MHVLSTQRGRDVLTRGGAKGGLGGGATPPPTDISKKKLCQNDYKFIYFSFSTKILNFFGTCNTPLERCFN